MVIEKGVLATDAIAKPAEDQRAEGAHDESGGKGQQRKDERRRGIEIGEELVSDDRGQGSVQIEVVPLEDRCPATRPG